MRKSLEFNGGDIDVEMMTELQGPDRRHLLPHAMASYILWVQKNLDRIKESFPATFAELRASRESKNGHRKMNEQIAYLYFTFDLVLQWALEKGAIGENDAGIARQIGKDAFLKTATKQAERIEQDDPLKLFFSIIDARLTQGKIRMDNKGSGYNGHKGGDSGELIGYYDEDYYYLIPPLVWHDVQAYLRLEGGHFPFSHNTLYAVLEKRGYIESKDGKHTLPVKIHGTVKRVLKIKRGGNDPFSSVAGVSADDE